MTAPPTHDPTRSERELALELALVEYIERFGLTERARAALAAPCNPTGAGSDGRRARDRYFTAIDDLTKTF